MFLHLSPSSAFLPKTPKSSYHYVVSTMPSSNQDSAAEQTQSAVDSVELQNFVSGYRRTSIDRSRPGIPADNYHDQYLQLDPSIGIASTSSGSPWEKVSATSHSSCFSLVEAPVNDNIPAPNQNQYESPMSPYTSTDAWPQETTSNNVAPLSPWDESVYARSSEAAFSSPQLPQPGFSDTIGPTAGTLAPSVYSSFPNALFDARAQGCPTFGQSFDGYNLYGGLDGPSVHQSSGFFNTIEEPSGSLNIPEFLDTTGSASPSEVGSTASRPPTSEPNLPSRECSQHLDVPPNRKRKRRDSGSPPKRINLKSINIVRKVGACFACKTLNEKV